jgi:hypothetical protein
MERVHRCRARPPARQAAIKTMIIMTDNSRKAKRDISDPPEF